MLEDYAIPNTKKTSEIRNIIFTGISCFSSQKGYLRTLVVYQN